MSYPGYPTLKSGPRLPEKWATTPLTCQPVKSVLGSNPLSVLLQVCRGSGRKVTLVGQSGNLDHVTMVCHLVMIVVEMYKDDLNIFIICKVIYIFHA